MQGGGAYQASLAANPNLRGAGALATAFPPILELRMLQPFLPSPATNATQEGLLRKGGVVAGAGQLAPAIKGLRSLALPLPSLVAGEGRQSHPATSEGEGGSSSR